jgi:uncharacterized protein YdaU (DUF1376 family)
VNKPDTYCPIVVGDYLKDTMHLSTVEHGAYFLLILHYWVQGSLPADPVKLSAIARLDANAYPNALPSHSERISERNAREYAGVLRTLSEFFDVTESNWIHKRIEAELTRAKAKSIKAMESSKARWGNKKNANAYPNAKRTHIRTQSSPTPTPYINKGEILEGSGGDGDDTVLGAQQYDMDAQWKARLYGFKPGKKWSPHWGPSPEGQGPWDAPKALVLAWRRQHGIDKEQAA